MAKQWAGEFLDRETTRTLRGTSKPLEAEDKSSITLLWRVENTAIPALLAQSGRRSPSGLRFFTEPGRWEAPAPPPCRCCYKEKRRQDETWEQYADRIYEASGVLGVARGDRSIGTRWERGVDDRDRRRTWRIEAVPVTHGYTDVASILREAGLKELVFLDNHHSPKPPGTTMACRTWVVRAEAPDDITSFEVVQNVCGQEITMYAYIACEQRRARPVNELPPERYTKFPM